MTGVYTTASAIGPEDAHERDREQHGGEGHQHVERSHDELIGHALGVARDQTERSTDHDGEQRRRHGHAEGDAIGVDHATEQAAAEIVAAERLGRGRRAEGEILRDVGGTAERQHRREERGEREHADDGEAGERLPHRCRTLGSMTPYRISVARLTSMNIAPMTSTVLCTTG